LPRQSIDWGVACRAKPGESRSGDRHVVAALAGGALLAAMDGVGHGPDAAAAAAIAAEILESAPDAPVLDLIRRCHGALAHTRGVALSLASFDDRQGTLSWSGVGNVAGVVVRADASALPGREELLLRAGVLGHQLPELRASVLPVSPGDVLVFATDGIRRDFPDRLSGCEPPRLLADRILADFALAGDDALVLAVCFHGGGRA
jgi:hypothetical protein